MALLTESERGVITELMRIPLRLLFIYLIGFFIADPGRESATYSHARALACGDTGVPEGYGRDPWTAYLIRKVGAQNPFPLPPNSDAKMAAEIDKRLIEHTKSVMASGQGITDPGEKGCAKIVETIVRSENIPIVFTPLTSSCADEATQTEAAYSDKILINSNCVYLRDPQNLSKKIIHETFHHIQENSQHAANLQLVMATMPNGPAPTGIHDPIYRESIVRVLNDYSGKTQTSGETAECRLPVLPKNRCSVPDYVGGGSSGFSSGPSSPRSIRMPPILLRQLPNFDGVLSRSLSPSTIELPRTDVLTATNAQEFLSFTHVSMMNNEDPCLKRIYSMWVSNQVVVVLPNGTMQGWFNNKSDNWTGTYLRLTRTQTSHLNSDQLIKILATRAGCSVTIK